MEKCGTNVFFPTSILWHFHSVKSAFCLYTVWDATLALKWPYLAPHELDLFCFVFGCGRAGKKMDSGPVKAVCPI